MCSKDVEERCHSPKPDSRMVFLSNWVRFTQKGTHEGNNKRCKVCLLVRVSYYQLVGYSQLCFILNAVLYNMACKKTLKEDRNKTRCKHFLLTFVRSIKHKERRTEPKSSYSGGLLCGFNRYSNATWLWNRTWDNLHHTIVHQYLQHTYLVHQI